MRVAVFDTHSFERDAFVESNQKFEHELTFFEPRLTPETAAMAKTFPVVCAFANDRLNRNTLERLAQQGTRLIALRSAGFNHVDLYAARDLGLPVVRVPGYSPYAVAEHAVGLLLSLNRKTHRAYQRVREFNFSLDGLVGFDLHGKKIGVIGTGRIGTVFSQIMLGFGTEVLAHDLQPNSELSRKAGVRYVTLPELLSQSDVISLHVPLVPETHYLIDEGALSLTKKGVILINTGRGGLVETKALLKRLKSGHIGAAGLDVYEEEENVFFKDLSDQIVQDDLLARLLTFPNVLITSHQGFLTREALQNIADTTLQSINDFEQDRPLRFQVSLG